MQLQQAQPRLPTCTSVDERVTRSSRGKHSYPLGDPEQVERDLNQQLKRMHLYAANTTGDGNCLFRALSDQLYGSPDRHAQLRQETCDHLASRSEKFAGFVDDKPFDEYVRLMRESGTYGGHLELHAFAQMKLKQIKIVQPGLVYVVEGEDDSPAATRARREKERERFRIQNTVEVDPQSRPHTDRQQRRQNREESKRKKKSASALLAAGETATSKASSESPPPEVAGSATCSNTSHLVEAYGPLYLAYHNWEHYSSVRNVDGPHTGLPRIKEKVVAAEQEEEDSQPAEPTMEEKMVMQSTCGAHALRDVRRLLHAHQNDWAHVVELLVENDSLTDEEKVGAVLQAVPGHKEESASRASSTLVPPTSLPDHMRQWRAVSPSSVDTCATHSSGEGDSPSTTATTEDGVDTACATPDAISLSRGSTPGIEKVHAKRAASSDPMGMSSIRSPKRRSQSRSPDADRSKDADAPSCDDEFVPSSDPVSDGQGVREEYEIIKRGRGRPRKDGLPNKSSIAVRRRVPTARERRDAAQTRKRERQLDKVAKARTAQNFPTHSLPSVKPSPAEVCGFRELKI